MTRQNIRSGNPYEDVYGYCRAVRVGNSVHVAGTTAQPPNVDGCDAYEQAKAALSIIEAALIEAGTDRSSVVRTVTYITDMQDMDLVARAHSEMFAAVRPAASLIGVSAFVDPQLKVEIEAYAIVDET